MKKTINEASVKIDVQGLESSDLETLSRMLALAGQAEKSMAGGMKGMPALAPLDLDSIGSDDETQPIMNPDDAMSADSQDNGIDDLSSTIDDLSGTVNDFGADADDSVSLDLDGQPAIQSEPEEVDDFSTEVSEPEDDFDINQLGKFAGLGESVITEDAAEEEVDTDKEMDDNLDKAEEDSAEEELDEAQILPDLSIDEDAISGDNQPQDFGPFNSEFDAVQNAQQKTNGVEGDNFIVVPKGNAYYWRRTVQEDATNEPEPSFYDTDGIEHSRHKFKDKFPGTALGDNPLQREVHESTDEDSEDCDEEESVDAIYESIEARYAKFLGGK